MEILLLAIVIGLIPAAIAKSKGHSFLLWWLFGAALWIVAMPCALLLKQDQAAMDASAMASGALRKRPHCAELIRTEAKVCRFCGRDIEPAANPIPPQPALWS